VRGCRALVTALIAALVPGLASGAGPAKPEAATADPEPTSPFGRLQPVVQQGHIGPIRALSFSDDGLLLASSGGDHRILIWDVAGGHVVRALEGHRGPVRGLDFGSGGRFLVSASEDGTIRLWDLRRGRARARIDVGLPLFSVAASPDGRLLAAGVGRRSPGQAADNAIRVFEAGSGNELARLAGHRAPVHQLDFTRDGRLLVSASADRSVRLWSMQSWEARAMRLVRSLEGRRAALLPATGRIATVGAHPYRSITVSELHSGRRIKRLPASAARIERLAGSPTGLYVAAGDEQGAVRVIEVRTGRTVRTFEGGGPLAFSPDGHLLAVARADGSIGLYQPLSGRTHRELAGRTGSINALDFSTDGRNLAAADRDGTTRIWNLDTGRLVRKLLGHEAAVRSVAYSPTKSFVATAADDGFLLLFDTALGKLHDEVEISGVRRILYSPDGRHLAAAGGAGTRVMPADSSLIGEALCFSPDSRHLLLRRPGRPLQVHDLASGELEGQLDVPDASVAAYAPDGSALAAAAPGSGIVLLDPRGGKRTRVLPSEGGAVVALGYSPDSRLLAVGNRDGGVRLLDAASGEIEHRLWHAGAVRDLRFSSDGRYLASASDDGALRLWNPRTGQPLLQAVGLPGHAFVAIWSDGRILVPADAGDRLRFTEGLQSFEMNAALERLPHPELVAPLD